MSAIKKGIKAMAETDYVSLKALLEDCEIDSTGNFDEQYVLNKLMNLIKILQGKEYKKYIGN